MSNAIEQGFLHVGQNNFLDPAEAQIRRGQKALAKAQRELESGNYSAAQAVAMINHHFSFSSGSLPLQSSSLY